MELAAGLLVLLVFGTIFHLVMRRKPGDERRVLPVAVRHCVDCSEAAQCRAWVASGARDGYQWFCPNADYVARAERLAR